ncbi:oligosaccharide flippase family protein [Streptomyces sp. WAC07094]|uniref:lipopolysaccharide biosynthesis protein n=1 Tax=Streptomyces sp. WAC07094 TaxID=3072183 RepID=UPI002EA97CF5|nr:oligosaccharide flippase family protein [Streptomyces sp. WAC07094]
MDDRRPQFAWILLARAGTLAMGILASVVVARALPPEGRGTYYMAVTVATAAMTLGHLSVDQAQTAMWAREGQRPSLDANSLPLGLVIGSAAAALAIGLGLVFQGSANVPDVSLLATACAGVPLGMSVFYGTNIMVLRSRTGVAGRAMLASALAQCLCLVVLGLTGHLTVQMVVVAWVVSMAAPLAVLIAAGGVTLGLPDLGLAAATCAKGLRLHAGSAAAYLLLRSDVFLLNALAGPREVGIYTLAVTLADLSRVAVDVFSQVTLSLQFDGDVSGSAMVTARIVRFTVLLGVASAVTTVTAVSILIVPLYGHAYAAAATLVGWLVPGVLLLSAARPLSNFLLRQRSSRLVVFPSLIALVVNVGLNAVAIPVWGAIGCALASTVAYGTLVAFQVAYFSRVSGLGWTCLLPTSAETARFTMEVKHRFKALRIGGVP